MWFGDGRFLLWSDIPNNRVMKWEEETGAGRASSASRRTTPTATPATARAGSSPASTTRAASRAPSTTAPSRCWPTRYDGKPLNSPNDVVCKSDGSDLVQRPAVRHSRQLRGARRHAGARRRTSTGSTGADRPASVATSDDQSAERALLLARRVEALRRRQRRHAARDPRLRRRGRRDEARQQSASSSTPATASRRHALRRRRQPLVRVGRGRARPRRRGDLRPRGQAHRPHPAARSAAPTSASAASSATGSSWRPASRSTRST